MFKSNTQNEIDYESTIYKYLYRLPPKGGRYIVLDTETTGLNENAQVVELGAHEIMDGKLTGGQFHIFIRPRLQMEEIVIRIHQITNNYYNDFYQDIYQDDKQNLINFLNWVGDSLIFAHNATFDMNALNLELKFWGLKEFPLEQFRCSMRIFKEIIGRIEPYFDDKFICLEKCCRFFELNSNEKCFHNALFDSFMTGRVICKLYEILDTNIEIQKELKYDPNLNEGDNKLINNNENNINKNNNYELKNKNSIIYQNNEIEESGNMVQELKSESTSSTGGLDELTEKNKEDKMNNQLEQLEHFELTYEMIDDIFNLL
jgi:DNA polymerase III epsilon subunit family exonuclease